MRSVRSMALISGCWESIIFLVWITQQSAGRARTQLRLGVAAEIISRGHSIETVLPFVHTDMFCPVPLL